MENDLIYFGGEVKLLDSSGRVGGYLVRFTDASHKDLSGDYFNADTYFGPTDGNGAECLYEHGYPVIPENKQLNAETVQALKMLADRTFKPLKTFKDTIGIFAETILDIEDEYEKFIHDRVKAGKVGWSSASSGHRVKRAADGYLSRWPIAEGSLTPRPCEPLNKAVTMKSLASMKFVGLDDDVAEAVKQISASSLTDRLNQFIDDRIEDGHEREATVKHLAREAMMSDEQIEAILKNTARPSNARLIAFARVLDVPYESLKALRDNTQPRSIKDLFEEELAENTPGTWALWNAYCSVVSDIAEAAQANAGVGNEFDYQAKLTEATASYTAKLQEAVVGQIGNYLSQDESENGFYLKSTVVDLSSVSDGMDVDDHCSLAESAFKGIVARFKQFYGTRVKAGRVLSEKMRTRIKNLRDQMSTLVADCDTILDQTKPMADEAAKNAVLAKNLVLRHERRQQLGA